MIAMDPQQQIPISLKSDQAKPAASRPTFYARVLTAREHAQASRLLDEAAKPGDAEASLNSLVALAKVTLQGWARVQDRGGNGVAFAPERLPDLLTTNELWELAVASITASSVTEDDKKKSESPSAGSGATSAPAAPAAGV